MAFLTRYELFQLSILQVFYIFFPFVLGALMAKYKVVEYTKSKLSNGYLPWILFIALIIVRYFVRTGAVISFYSAAIVILVAAAYKPKWFIKLLSEFGRTNVWMWMVHAWICWYIWPEAIYSLGNPLLIFLATVVATYIIAVVFDIATRPIFKKIFN